MSNEQKMKDAMKKALENLKNDPTILDEIIKDREERDKKLAEFYQSSRFDNIIEKIQEILKTDEGFGDNPYQEPLFADVSNEEFIQVFSCLFNKEISGLTPTNVHEGFYESSVIFKGIKFLEIYGQGTAFIVQRESGVTK